jgi:hypothetical protein
VGTSILIGATGGAAAGGTAGYNDGLVAGLKASAAVVGWAFERLGKFVSGPLSAGPLGRLLSFFYCPTGMTLFLMTEGVNRVRALDRSIPSKNLGEPLTTLFGKYFPNMRFDEISIYDNLEVFPPWAAGITFRKTIFIKYALSQCDYDVALLLMHELVHVKQYHEWSFWSFACRYADEVVRGLPRNIREPNPLLMPGESLEDEAYNFVARNDQAMLAEMHKVCPNLPRGTAAPLAGHRHQR